MKKYIILSGIALMFSAMLTGQVISNNGINPEGQNENIFLDASTYFSEEIYAGGQNVGKGLVFPTVDLTKFEFVLTRVDGVKFPTYFNGMIVYNRTTGTTPTTGNRSSTATAVKPGFYYFYNPEGHINKNVTGGVWKPLGSGMTVDNVEGLRGITIEEAADILKIGLPTGKTGQMLVYENNYEQQIKILEKQYEIAYNALNFTEAIRIRLEIRELEKLLAAGGGDEWVGVDMEDFILGNEHFMTTLIDSLRDALGEGLTYTAGYGLTLNRNQFSLDVSILGDIINLNYTQLGDSIAYYFSKTALGDTILNYIQSLPTEIEVVSTDRTVNITGSGTSRVDLSVNIAKVGEGLVNNSTFVTNMGDALVSDETFVNNMGDELVSNETFVTNMGDSIAYFFSETVLGDTIKKYLLSSDTYITDLIEVIRETIDDTNTLYQAGFGLELNDTEFRVNMKQIIDSLSTLMNEDDFDITQFIQEIVNQISQEQYITQMGDSIAYYFSETALGDTILKYVNKNIDSNISLTSPKKTITVTDNATADIKVDVNIKTLADSLVNNETFVNNMGDELVSNETFVVNMGDSIAYFYSQTVLGDTIANHLLNSDTYITNLMEVIRETIDDTNTLYQAGFGLELNDTEFRVNMKQIIDSLSTLMNEDDFDITQFIQEIVNQISQEQYITQMGDSIAYYFSETALGDTIMKYVNKNIDSNVSLTSPKQTITITDNATADIKVDVNIKNLADSLVHNNTFVNNLGNELVNNETFVTNMGDEFLSSETFVTNMGDSIAYYFSQTDLGDTIKKYIQKMPSNIEVTSVNQTVNITGSGTSSVDLGVNIGKVGEGLVNNSTFVTNMGDALVSDETFVNNMGDELVSNETFVVNMGDSIAYFYSQTVLGDTIANHLLNSDTYITNLMEVIRETIDDTNTLYTAGYGLELNGNEFSADMPAIGDSLVNSDTFVTNMGNELVSNETFVVNMGDSIAYFYSQTVLGDTIANNLLNNDTYITNLMEVIRETIDDTNTLYTAGFGLELNGNEFSADMPAIGDSLVNSDTFVTNMGDALVNNETFVNNMGDELVSNETFVVNMGDSIAYFYSQTVLGDTIAKSLVKNDTYITELMEVIRETIDDTNTLYTAGYGLELNGNEFSADMPAIGDSLVNSETFVTNLGDELVSNETFVVNMGDSIAYFYSQTVLGDTIAKSLINNNTFITELSEVLSLEDTNTEYTAGYGLNLSVTNQFSADMNAINDSVANSLINNQTFITELTQMLTSPVPTIKLVNIAIDYAPAPSEFATQQTVFVAYCTSVDGGALILPDLTQGELGKILILNNHSMKGWSINHTTTEPTTGTPTSTKETFTLIGNAGAIFMWIGDRWIVIGR